MTSHTETTQTITETINSMDYNTGYQYSATGSGVTASGNLSPTPHTTNVTIEGVNSTWTGVGSKPTFTQTTPGAAFQFTETVKGSRAVKPHNYTKNNRGNLGNRYYKYILPIILSGLFPSQSLAETVGGVSATAAPVANSSGSVTNQAIQVLQGPYITNTYGGGVQCQGATRNFTPYVTGTTSFMRPYEAYYPSPVYDMRDLTGDFDDDGNDIPDGAPDSPGPFYTMFLQEQDRKIITVLG